MSVYCIFTSIVVHREKPSFQRIGVEERLNVPGVVMGLCRVLTEA
jgi:hypothetical protein